MYNQSLSSRTLTKNSGDVIVKNFFKLSKIEQRSDITYFSLSEYLIYTLSTVIPFSSSIANL
ncbi:MAG TPA: hypothetical protein PKW55_01725 [Spirochaetota bacterium]|nr:hypothetical protein [Spirochaetota bacterium]HOM38986.1 hypothetical protein [Spirochaetota bacterium]